MQNLAKHKWVGGVLLIGGAVLLYQYRPLTQAQRLNKPCQAFGHSFIIQHKNLFDNPNSRISFFYSKRLDTCIKKEVDELGNEYSLCDVRRKYIKRDLEDPAVCGMVFYCDDEGVDNVVLESAERYGGNLFRVSYSEYLLCLNDNVPFCPR